MQFVLRTKSPSRSTVSVAAFLHPCIPERASWQPPPSAPTARMVSALMRRPVHPRFHSMSEREHPMLSREVVGWALRQPAKEGNKEYRTNMDTEPPNCKRFLVLVRLEQFVKPQECLGQQQPPCSRAKGF